MILPLVYYGHPLLRKRAKPLAAITAEVRELVKNMVVTMDHHDGVGLAAPQVGCSIRLFVLCNSVEEEGKIILTDAQVYINPSITSSSKEKEVGTEGCLSVPHLREKVERPLRITVEALDLQGNLFQEELEGYKARVVLHEFDHLEGKLFIDHISKQRKKALAEKLQTIERRYCSSQQSKSSKKERSSSRT